MRRILITGSNRGIGLELVKQYLLEDETLIFATCRFPDEADELNTIADQNTDRVVVLELDVSDEYSINQALRAVKARTKGLELLINNAGILPGGVDNLEDNISCFGSLNANAMLDLFRINSISPIIVAQAFSEMLYKGKNARVVNLSSSAGSISRWDDGCIYGYPASKAALNMLTRCLAGDFRPNDVIVAAINPGSIQTEMGGENAKLTLDEAVPNLVDLINNLKLDDTGQFFHWDGEVIAW